MVKIPVKTSIPQSDPPRSPRETLPTMYDLPSENPEEPGLDEFHLKQSNLLSKTFQPTNQNPDQVFCATDLNLYYDVTHPQWYKRPDWFGVSGVSKLYEGRELRLSYVTWQERINPLVVVELLSPSTEDEDLGRTTSAAGQPPTKWQVYEEILRVPYYIIFSRYTNQLQFFQLTGARYQEQELAVSAPQIWIPELELGLGLWEGDYESCTRWWLRWCDRSGNLILTPTERAEQAILRAENLAQKLRELGVNPDEV